MSQSPKKENSFIYQSSYHIFSNLHYDDIFKSFTFQINPKRIVEFGILNGYSLKVFLENSDSNCQVDAYDIFDNFNGKHANYQDLQDKFKDYPNLSIADLDYYQGHLHYPDNSIDILHIDIANDRTVYQFAIQNYLSKLTEKGIIILEGGSKERDQISWMQKYNKIPINPYLQQLKEKGYQVLLLEKMPSVTIIKKHKHKHI